MTTQEITSYIDTSQVDAVKVLKKVTSDIRRWVTSLTDSKRKIGAALNMLASTGLAMAAEYSIDSGKRDWSAAAEGSEDKRTTAVSRYVADNFPTLTRGQVSEYRKIARDFDSLEEQEVDTSGFADSAFKALRSDATAEDFAQVVSDMLDAEEPNLTAAAFIEAGRAAGIVTPAKGGGGDPFQRSLNTLLKEGKKFVGDNRTPTKNQMKQIDRLVDSLKAIAQA